MLITRTRRGTFGVAAAIVSVIGVLLALPWMPHYVGIDPPPQYYRALGAAPDPGQRRVLGIGHNAGNHPATTAAALAHHADVVEIDVVLVNGVLAAGRERPWRWLADRVFQGQTLTEACRAASAARIVQLDLQQTHRELLDALISFLQRDRGTGRIMVSTRDAAAVQYLAPRLPATVTPVLSVPFPDTTRRLENDLQLQRAIRGISVYRELVDASLVRWAHAHRWTVLAWPVDDAASLDRVVRAGVDGVSTDNLAVLDAVAG